MKKQRMLVTGASGLLGAQATRFFARYFKTIGIYHSNLIPMKGAELVSLDLRKKEKVNRLLAEFEPDVIFHAAAMVDVDYCEGNPKACMDMNYGVTATLTDYCAQNQKKIIYISTDAFFNLVSGEMAIEEQIPTPLSVYSESKWKAENYILENCPNNLIVRTNIYGWNAQNKFSFAEWILDGIVHGRKMNLFKDVIYSPILVNTLARIINDLLKKDIRGVVHVAGTEAISKLEFAHRLTKAFDLSSDSIIPISIRDINFKANRSNNMSLSVKKLSSICPELVRSVDRDLIEFRNLLVYGEVERIKGKAYLEDLRYSYTF